MTLAEITLPEVKAHTQAGRFFRRGNKDYIEISFIGSKDTINQAVTPEHMAKFKAEWDAYCDGNPPMQRPGIPLTDLPTISEARAQDYIHRNVHNLEELAALNDGQCQSLGHGTLTDRKAARELVSRRQMQERDKLQREVQQKSAAIGPQPAEKYASASDVEALKAGVDELKGAIGKIAELFAAKPKPGRPKKTTESTD